MQYYAPCCTQTACVRVCIHACSPASLPSPASRTCRLDGIWGYCEMLHKDRNETACCYTDTNMKIIIMRYSCLIFYSLRHRNVCLPATRALWVKICVFISRAIHLGRSYVEFHTHLRNLSNKLTQYFSIIRFVCSTSSMFSRKMFVQQSQVFCKLSYWLIWADLSSNSVSGSMF